jgi:putative chitinase
MLFDRKLYFDSVRASLFSGALSQQQVEGQEAILGEWEVQPWAGVDPDTGELTEAMTDVRWLAYMLATAYHETAQTMWPIEEYGKGVGQPYGVKDPYTGQTYYGRGFVQLTWRDNYRHATEQLGLKGDADLEWHADQALEPQIASDVMFLGMADGWFRSDSQGKQTLGRYFSDIADDPYGAREIINGDKHIVPDWANGISIGNLIKDYHGKFLTALKLAASEEAPEPEPMPKPLEIPEIVADVTVRGDVLFTLIVNGVEMWSTEKQAET